MNSTKNINIRRLVPEDSAYLREAESLFQTTGAWANLPNNTLTAFSASPTCAVFGAFENCELVGCSVAGILGESHFKLYKVYGSHLASKLLPGNVANMIGVVVKTNYRGIGVGKELLKVQTEWAKKNGAKYAISNSWVNKTSQNSAKLFDSDGFQVITRFCNLQTIIPSDQALCPNCGQQCRCENIIYLKQL